MKDLAIGIVLVAAIGLGFRALAGSGKLPHWHPNPVISAAPSRVESGTARDSSVELTCDGNAVPDRADDGAQERPKPIFSQR